MPLAASFGAVFGSQFWINAGLLAAIYGLFTAGMQLNIGLTGLYNFGQAGFMAVGAYAMAILVVNAGWSFWAALPTAAAIAMAVALIVGLPSLRLRGDYFAIVTIAASETIQYLIQNIAVTGGNQGLLGFTGEWTTLSTQISNALGLSAGDYLVPLLLVGWALLLLAIAALAALRRTPWGRVLRAIRDDQDAARSLGKPIFRYKVQSLAIASLLAAVSGYLLALDLAFLSPNEFTTDNTFIAAAMLLVGGLGSYLGVLVRGGRDRGRPQCHAQPGPAWTAPLRLPARGAALHRHRRAARRTGGMAPAGPPRAPRRDGPRMTADAILEVRGAQRAFRGVVAVADASFTVARGSITALIGPNGAGKTTMFDLISGFLRPDRGEVLFDGAPIGGRPPERIAQAGLVRTFQLTRTFATLSVLDNMLVGAAAHPGERLTTLVLTLPAARRRERAAREQAREILERFGLSGHADALAGTLSGGQRKLLELARALMARPRLLLLDEPMAGVNPTMGLALLERIEQIRAQDGVTVLFVEHDLEVVMRHSEHVIVMAAGTVIADGPPELIQRDPRVLDAYMGSGGPPAAPYPKPPAP